MSEDTAVENITAFSEVFEANATAINDAVLNSMKKQFSVIANVYFWWHVIVIPFGILGNLLCLLALSQKQNRSISCSVYMRALAVADSCLLAITAAYFVAVGQIASMLEESKLVMCKVVVFFTFTSSQCGVLIILALLVERVIAVMKPLKAAILLSPKRALIITFCIVIFSVIFNIPYIYVASVIQGAATDSYMHCASDAAGNVAAIIHSMANLILNGVLPFIAILVMNLMILYSIKSSKHGIRKYNRDKSTTSGATEVTEDNHGSPQKQKTTEMCSGSTAMSNESPNPEGADAIDGDNKPHKTISGPRAGSFRGRNQRNRQLTWMTIVMTIAFIVCTLPKFVHILIFRNIDYQHSPARQLWFGWSGTIAQMLNTLNSAINFFMYVLTGSRFRADLLNLFQCRNK